MTDAGPLHWCAFAVVVGLLLLVDLRMGGRTTLNARQSLIWSAIWIGAAIAFGLFVLFCLHYYLVEFFMHL